MDILLSSFCFNDRKIIRHPTETQQGFDGKLLGETVYSYLPPVSLRTLGSVFSPDYGVFLLGDNFYIDYETMEIVEKNEIFAKHKELFSCLKTLDRLKIVDYKEIIEPYSSIIQKSYISDLKEISDWKEDFLELCSIWFEYVNSYRGRLPRTGSNLSFKYNDKFPENASDIHFLLSNSMVPGLDDRIIENLKRWDKKIPAKDRKYTRDVLAPYLVHINSTLCLSEKLGATIHDWGDLTPLYRKKFAQCLKLIQDENLDEQSACSQFMRLMFPDFIPKDERSLLKLFDSKHIYQLKEMIKRSIENDVSFDNEFANNLLKEIVQKEQKIKHYRNIIGWMTMPLSIIPYIGGAAEKGVNIAVEKLLKKNIRKDKAWFYLLSEVNLSNPLH